MYIFVAYLLAVVDEGQELVQAHVATQARAARVEAALVPDDIQERQGGQMTQS